MDKNEIEKYKRSLELIESELTDEEVRKMTKEERREYMILVSQIKARLEILENL